MNTDEQLCSFLKGVSIFWPFASRGRIKEVNTTNMIMRINSAKRYPRLCPAAVKKTIKVILPSQLQIKDNTMFSHHSCRMVKYVLGCTLPKRMLEAQAKYPELCSF